MATQQAFWLDNDYDREHAPHGDSRFGAEVRRRCDEFADSWGDIAPVSFAVTAWRLATTLSPGYVRWHRRILSASCTRSPYDGSLVGEVNVISGWPAELTWSLQWTRDNGWRDWPRVFGQYVSPSERDLTRSPHLRSMLLVEAPLPLTDLPAAPDGPDADLEQTARRAVTVVTRHLNDLLTPMIGQLDAGVPAEF